MGPVLGRKVLPYIHKLTYLFMSTFQFLLSTVHNPLGTQSFVMSNLNLWDPTYTLTTSYNLLVSSDLWLGVLFCGHSFYREWLVREPFWWIEGLCPLSVSDSLSGKKGRGWRLHEVLLTCWSKSRSLPRVVFLQISTSDSPVTFKSFLVGVSRVPGSVGEGLWSFNSYGCWDF